MGNLQCCANIPTSEAEAVNTISDVKSTVTFLGKLDTSDDISSIFLELFDDLFKRDMTEDEIQSGFDMVDMNKDGTWDESEIRSYLKKMEKPEENAEQLITQMPSSRLQLSDVKAIIRRAIKAPGISHGKIEAEQKMSISLSVESLLSRVSSLRVLGEPTDAEIQQTFYDFDSDQDGLLRKEEAQQAISHLGLNHMETSVLLENLPDCKIGFHTFLEVAQPDLRVGIMIAELCKNKLSEDDLKRCFAQMDVNGKGYVDKTALNQACLLANMATRDQIEEAMNTMEKKWMSLKDFRIAAEKGLRHQISKAFARRHDIHSSGEIMCLPSVQPDGLETYIYELEKKHNVPMIIKYAVSYEERSKMWRAMAITSEDAMQPRRPFPSAWRGLKGTSFPALQLEGSFSVSRNGTVGMHEMKEGAIAMAIIALKDGDAGALVDPSCSASIGSMPMRAHRSTRASLKLIKSRSSPVL